MGAISLSLSLTHTHSPPSYDSLPACQTALAENSTCTVTLDVPRDMQPPVFVFYQMTNFYQNHRRYVKSRSNEQLRGEEVSFSQMADCSPLRTVEEQPSTGVGNQVPESALYYPCGLIAASFFQDSYALATAAGGVPKPIDGKGIAWPTDAETFARDERYYVDKDSTDIAADAPSQNVLLPEGVTVEDEDFIVWMRTAALPSFRKLKGVIRETVAQGAYDLTITPVLDVSMYKGSLSFVLSTSSWIGGQNYALGYSYLVVGGLSVLLGVAFATLQQVSPRALGDPRHLSWVQFGDGQ